MAYIGRPSIVGNFVKLDAITAVNGQAAYTMQNNSVNFTDYSTVNQFLVSLNGTIQSPGSSFTVSGSTLTFASNLSTGDVIDFIIVFGNSLSAGVPTDDTVSTAKIVDDAVTAAKINNDIISGQTALASEPADTDEFLVSDAGTLKRIDYSLIKGGGITEADQWRITSAYDYPSSGATQFSANWERIDTDSPGLIGSGMTESSGVFTFPSTGIYLVHFFTNVLSAAASNYIGFYTDLSTDGGGSFDYLNGNWDSADASARAMAISAQSLVDVTSTSNVKVRFTASASGSGHDYQGNTGVTYTGATFIRLGDT